MECKYHILLDSVINKIWDTIHPNFIPNYFQYWIGDQSHLENIYIEEYIAIYEEEITPEQSEIFEKMGKNLEKTIYKWYMSNTNISFLCLRYKINYYLTYQFKKQELLAFLGPEC